MYTGTQLSLHAASTSAAWSDATLCAVNTLAAACEPPSRRTWLCIAVCYLHEFVGNKLHRSDNGGVDRPCRYIGPAPPSALTSNIVHPNTDRYSPKSRNCFMERGDGENFEKCSMCFGTLANTAFFMINLTNFIVDAEGPGSGKQPRRPIDSAPQSAPASLSQPPLETGGRSRRERSKSWPIGEREVLFTSSSGQ